MADGKWEMAKGQKQNQQNNAMAKYERFEHLPVWQEAARLYNLVLDLLEEPRGPAKARVQEPIGHGVAVGFEQYCGGL